MEQAEEEQGAGEASPANPETWLQDGKEPFTSASVASSSSSNADLPSVAPAARCLHTSRTFTGLRMFCRR